MSGARGGGVGGHGFYGDLPAVAAFDHDGDDYSFFFRRPACGGGLTAPAPYSSAITDYLCFLDPVALARNFDSPPPCPLGCGGGDAAVNQLVEAVAVDVGDHIYHHVGGGDLQAGDAAAPVTPISSVLSSSSEVAGEDGPPPRWKKGGEEDELEEEEIDEEGSSGRQIFRSKARKKGEKKQAKAREPRVAFMTRSEVDHLEDGYRWRKYGQKAVKNSSYPRSYYRCTAARCGVKKRLERSQQDPSTVITTYEGQHTHPSPLTHIHRGVLSATARMLLRPNAAAYSLAAPPPPPLRPDLARAMSHQLGHAHMCMPSTPAPPMHLLQEHRFAFADYAPQDLVPSMIGHHQHEG